MIVVLGGGESGIGAAILAKRMGLPVFLSDKGMIKETYKNELAENDIPFEEGQHTEAKILEATMVVKSPGIPDTVPLVKLLVEKEIPVISEIEFASQYTQSFIVGITGSNGKTTTTNLIYHILQQDGMDVKMGGNVGESFARLVATDPASTYVLELSSFQLDGIVDFKPNIALLLNITPDHLDRYDYDLGNYAKAKCRIAENLFFTDTLIYNGDDKVIAKYLKTEEIESWQIKVPAPKESQKTLTIDGYTFELNSPSLKGPHNAFNAACAIRVALRMFLKPESIQQGLDTFVNAPHRLELIASVDGVDYINDSKATNVDAVYYALAAMDRPIIWIAGGTDKGNDYTPVMDLVKEKVTALICLGVDNEKLISTFGDTVNNISSTQSTVEAIRMATDAADAGDVVLLSPACASFDLFKNYIDRGDQFRAAVLELSNSLNQQES